MKLLLGRDAEFYACTGEGHVLKGKAWETAMRRTIKYFDSHLK